MNKTDNSEWSYWYLASFLMEIQNLKLAIFLL